MLRFGDRNCDELFSDLLQGGERLRAHPSLGQLRSGGEVPGHNSCVALMRMKWAFHRYLFK
jgi:hypothetical protein